MSTTNGMVVYYLEVKKIESEMETVYDLKKIKAEKISKFKFHLALQKAGQETLTKLIFYPL